MIAGGSGDICDLSIKYDLPDITLSKVTPEHIRCRCREWSRKISMKVTMTKRKIPPMLVLSKIYTDHYTFPLMEARAITTLCTGNLIYKNWAIWKFRMKNSGDLRCMFPPFQEPDTMLHV